MTPAREMPKYKCHKEVHALKIADVVTESATGRTFIVPTDEGYERFEVDQVYIERHRPQPGGYFVRYEDGYTSFSPATAFESGYTRSEA